ncbi:MAG: GLUG motif-containing protein, partial [Clostridia bacterium]|nr:GLUG motif-containing protein [Clostridia bacterium]
YNTGDISCSANDVGGVAGENNGSILTNCHNTGSVNGTGNNVGGVVGYNYSTSTVSNCYNTGSVSGTGNNIGGVVGYNQTTSTVTGSYNTGTVSGTSTGSLIGKNDSGCVVSYCYYLGTTPYGTNSGTWTNNSAITTSATLLTNLNAWVTANPTTNGITNLAWQIITGVNGGYPVFD